MFNVGDIVSTGFDNHKGRFVIKSEIADGMFQIEHCFYSTCTMTAFANDMRFIRNYS